MTQTALYAQDQWALARVSLNLGLRFDGLNATAPAVQMPAGPFVPERDFPEAKNIPNWKDISPRVGVSVDLFGNGRSALKVSLGRFISYESTAGLPADLSPVGRMVGSAIRTWNDRCNLLATGCPTGAIPNDFVPQESELGPYDNSNFGKTVPGTTYDPDVIDGWQVRPYNWQGGVSFTQQLSNRLAVNVGYYRTWYGNFMVTDNMLVSSSNFDSYCITVPSTANIPTAGQEVCNLYDVTPSLFGRVQNFVTKASNFGKQTEVYNGIDLTINARLPGAGIVTGGYSTGQTVTDSCEVRTALPETAQNNPFCRNEQAWNAQSAFKVSISTPLPWDFQASANYQNSPGVGTAATYSVGAAEVAPSLHRTLASGPTGRATVTVLEPNTVYREGRISQLGLALSRNFRHGSLRFAPRIELHNALNANPIVQLNNVLGPSFDVVRGILAPRMLKFAFRVDF